MPRSLEVPAGLGFDHLAEVKQFLGLELRPDPDGPVQKVRLVRDLPHRLGLIERRDGVHLDTPRPQRLDGAGDLGLAVTDVRAETEIAGPQTPSSSSGSRSSERSRVT